MKYNKYIVTAAFPYANGPIHIGHLSGVYFPADIFVRFLRRKKKDVIFISGSDEHGAPISIQAKKENKHPKEIVNKYHKMIKKCFYQFGINFDNYSRTSSETHHKIATNVFKKLCKSNKIFQKNSNQFYDKKSKQYLADRYIKGICPFCKNKDAYGDQCEYCGIILSPENLINPKSNINNNLLYIKTTKHWYIPLNKYQKFLEKWILIDHKYDWKNNIYGQAKSWLNNGLEPRSITRDLDWGITIPNNKKKVLYVWFEAPIGYISSTIEWANKKNKNWMSYWKNKKTKLIQFIGKDNIVFHSIIFPVILKAYDNEYVLPKHIIANEFMKLENKKISTSKNWAIWGHEYLQYFPNQQDVIRYFLISNMPETKDSNFSWMKFKEKNNMELVATFGNFIHRNMILIKKYNQSVIPKYDIFSYNDKKILDYIKIYTENIGNLIKSYQFKKSIQVFMNLAKLGNKYLTTEEPWNKNKQINRRNTILYISMQIVAMLAQLSELFLPDTSKKLLQMLRLKLLCWSKIEMKSEIINPGHIIGKETMLFKKIEDKNIEIQIKKLHKIN